MIVDIEKIAEDSENVCYKSAHGNQPSNLFLVTKADLSVSAIVVGDSQTMAGALAKLRRSVKTGNFPANLTLATG